MLRHAHTASLLQSTNTVNWTINQLLNVFFLVNRITIVSVRYINHKSETSTKHVTRKSNEMRYVNSRMNLNHIVGYKQFTIALPCNWGLYRFILHPTNDFTKHSYQNVVFFFLFLQKCACRNMIDAWALETQSRTKIHSITMKTNDFFIGKLRCEQVGCNRNRQINRLVRGAITIRHNLCNIIP